MAAQIVPRWEWRTFGDSFGVAEEHFAALTPTGVQDSDEMYLLAPDSETVKVRFELMDIKVLREVDPFGLQRWEPVMKADVPLTEDELLVVFEALRQPLPPLAREGYTFAQFLDELVAPNEHIRLVPITKHRVRYSVAGCTSEVTDVLADGVPTRTIAIESEDREAVKAAVTAVGLDGFVNTAYPQGLFWLLSGRPPRYATIDVGTNSVKFHVAERTASGGWQSVADRAEVTQLGEGLAETGAIGTEPLHRTVEAIAGMVDQARGLDVRAVAAAGTAGLRVASNQAAVLAAIEAATGVSVEVVSGEEESRLAYLAAVAGLGVHDGRVVVFDTGGGSSQFTFGQGLAVHERFSLEVGAVRYTERFGLDGPVGQEVLDAARSAIREDLTRLGGRPAPDALVGMGGALTNMTAVMLGLDRYDPDRVQGAVLTRAEVDRQVATYAGLDAEARRGIVGLQPKRAEVILAGACIVGTVMDTLGRDALTVSDRGLRHGLLEERFAALHPPVR
jgi:exopolyphosphatase/guanosine-5'-triphosphate,3'-diphosphate pyrophosphatase